MTDHDNKPTSDLTFDPERDLVLERLVDVSPRLIWRAWTEPEQLVKWFAPRPWTTVRAEVDARPGGIFLAVMRSPDGNEFGSPGCVLDAVPEKRFVFTDTLGPGFRPGAEPFFTAVVTFTSEGTGTRYRVKAMHADAAAKTKHEEMGFHEGWSTCLSQLVECVKEN